MSFKSKVLSVLLVFILNRTFIYLCVAFVAPELRRRLSWCSFITCNALTVDYLFHAVVLCDLIPSYQPRQRVISYIQWMLACFGYSLPQAYILRISEAVDGSSIRRWIGRILAFGRGDWPHLVDRVGPPSWFVQVSDLSLLTELWSHRFDVQVWGLSLLIKLRPHRVICTCVGLSLLIELGASRVCFVLVLGPSLLIELGPSCLCTGMGQFADRVGPHRVSVYIYGASTC